MCMSRSILSMLRDTKFEVFILIHEAMIAKMSLIYFLLSGQSDPMAMKLKLDMSCHLLNVCHVYTKLQIDISKSKYVEKSLENF